MLAGETHPAFLAETICGRGSPSTEGAIVLAPAGLADRGGRVAPPRRRRLGHGPRRLTVVARTLARAWTSLRPPAWLHPAPAGRSHPDGVDLGRAHPALFEEG